MPVKITRKNSPSPTPQSEAQNDPELAQKPPVGGDQTGGDTPTPKSPRGRPSGPAKRFSTSAPSPEYQISRKKGYVGSVIPGLIPEKIAPTGRCLYSEEQLASVRRTVPSIEIEGGNNARGYLEREQEVSQVENLMLRGITNMHTIAGILNLAYHTVTVLVKAVHARWELNGGPRNASKVKGEAINKVSLIEQEYWNLFQKETTTAPIKVSILSNIVTLIDRKLLLHGLSPRVLETLAQEAPGENAVSTGGPMQASIEMKESLAEATREAVKLIALAHETVGDPVEENDDESTDIIIDPIA